LIPFQKPERYGRNILENSSFLVSSAIPQRNLRGNGFVARLPDLPRNFCKSGLLMNAGKDPFFLNQRGELNLRFQPVLAGWLFDRHGQYRFNFLSQISLTYHNPKRKTPLAKMLPGSKNHPLPR